MKEIYKYIPKEAKKSFGPIIESYLLELGKIDLQFMDNVGDDEIITNLKLITSTELGVKFELINFQDVRIYNEILTYRNIVKRILENKDKIDRQFKSEDSLKFKNAFANNDLKLIIYYVKILMFNNPFNGTGKGLSYMENLCSIILSINPCLIEFIFPLFGSDNVINIVYPKFIYSENMEYVKIYQKSYIGNDKNYFLSQYTIMSLISCKKYKMIKYIFYSSNIYDFNKVLKELPDDNAS